VPSNGLRRLERIRKLVLFRTVISTEISKHDSATFLPFKIESNPRNVILLYIMVTTQMGVKVTEVLVLIFR
jgi:hypothetical protein